MDVWELVVRESIRDRSARWNTNGAAPSDPAPVPVGRYLPPGGRPSIRHHHADTVQNDGRASDVGSSSLGVDQVDPDGRARNFDESVARTP